jgi:hypothetical protein
LESIESIRISERKRERERKRGRERNREITRTGGFVFIEGEEGEGRYYY